MYNYLTREISIPISIKVGVWIFLIVITAVLLFFGQHFGFYLTPLRFLVLSSILGYSCLSLIFLHIKIIITKFNREKFEHDYPIIIKCKNCGVEFHKPECPIYCPKCNEFLKLGFQHIIWGTVLIIFAVLFSFLLLTNLQQSQGLHLAFSMMGLFVLFGINFILYGTGCGSIKNKFYRFILGLLFFLFGLYCIFFIISSGNISLPPVLIFSIFAIIGFGIMFGKIKLMTEDQMAENLPKKGIGGLFKKLFEFKNKKNY